MSWVRKALENAYGSRPVELSELYEIVNRNVKVPARGWTKEQGKEYLRKAEKRRATKAGRAA